MGFIIMEKRVLGSNVETAVEKFFNFSYSSLMGLEGFLVDKNVIGMKEKVGIYEDLLDFPEDDENT